MYYFLSHFCLFCLLILEFPCKFLYSWGYSAASYSKTSQVNCIVSERNKSGMYSKRASVGNKKFNAAPCSCFLYYSAFLRLAAVRAGSLLPDDAVFFFNPRDDL
jgi:hypothetical protein